MSRKYYEIKKEYFTMFENTRLYSKARWTEALNMIYKIKGKEIEEYL